MKNIMIVGLTVAGLSALPVQAQTTQQGVVGASGVAGFPVSVRGSDGALYSCRDEITQTADGRPKRECIPAEDDGTVFSAGTGFEISPAAGAIAIAVLAIAAGGGSSTATTGALSGGGS